MLYRFICKECKNVQTVNCSHEDLKGLEMKCDKCGSNMRRDWKTVLTVGLGDDADSIQSTSVVKERLKVRPSGKTQVFY